MRESNNSSSFVGLSFLYLGQYKRKSYKILSKNAKRNENVTYRNNYVTLYGKLCYNSQREMVS